MRLFILTGFACFANALAPGSKSHVVVMLVDDWGWANAGWHREAGFNESATPHMDELVKEGIELNHHYVFKFCSPSRCATLSGRNPVRDVVESRWNLRRPRCLVARFKPNPICLANPIKFSLYWLPFGDLGPPPQVHVNTNNIDPSFWNPADPVSGYAGIPRNMSTFANKLQEAGYETHAYGKVRCR